MMTNQDVIEILKTLLPTGKAIVRFDCGVAGRLTFNIQTICPEDGLTIISVYGAPPNAEVDANRD